MAHAQQPVQPNDQLAAWRKAFRPVLADAVADLLRNAGDHDAPPRTRKPAA